jgi:hypothetical protein
MTSALDALSRIDCEKMKKLSRTGTEAKELEGGLEKGK